RRRLRRRATCAARAAATRAGSTRGSAAPAHGARRGAARYDRALRRESSPRTRATVSQRQSEPAPSMTGRIASEVRHGVSGDHREISHRDTETRRKKFLLCVSVSLWLISLWSLVSLRARHGAPWLPTS